MVDRRFLRAAGVIVAAMWLAGALALHRLPAGARVATHFDAAGAADGWSPATTGLFVVPAVASLMALLFGALPSLDPKGHNLMRSAKAVRTIGLAVLLLLAVVHLLVAGPALGLHWDVPRALLLALGALFAVIGNVLGKLRPSFTVGIRTPWTLADDRVWDQTHRFGGRCFVAGGLLLVAASFVEAGPHHLLALVLVVALGSTLACVLQSWRLWHRVSNAR